MSLDALVGVELVNMVLGSPLQVRVGVNTGGPVVPGDVGHG
jgi:hypothetical protein